ncbi:MAG: cytochrome d ubiquinol oxidase subunit II [Thermodesulfobacteriota bacterium]
MFGNLDLSTLQQLWWLIASLVGSLFLFLTFVQGGQTLLVTSVFGEVEKRLVINSLGRKWELTFTTLVLFGGALFAAFPLFYATSFGGAYWVWVAILFTFIVQAVAYEYRKKPDNLLGPMLYEFFLFLNGSVGILLIGAAVGTFFTGSRFSLDVYNSVTWHSPLRGLEAAGNGFNLSLGLFLVFLARVLGAQYLLNNIDFGSAPGLPQLRDRLRRATLNNFLLALPFLLFVLLKLVTMDGYAITPHTGAVVLESGKYLHNLLAMPILLILLLAGLLLVIWSVVATVFKGSDRGIWFAGVGTVLVGLVVFGLAGYNNTPFYPSIHDPASSLSIYNASSSHYTLTAMSYVALAVPFVLGYIVYFWRKMDSSRLRADEVAGSMGQEAY